MYPPGFFPSYRCLIILVEAVRKRNRILRNSLVSSPMGNSFLYIFFPPLLPSTKITKISLVSSFVTRLAFYRLDHHAREPPPESYLLARWRDLGFNGRFYKSQRAHRCSSRCSYFSSERQRSALAPLGFHSILPVHCSLRLTVFVLWTRRRRRERSAARRAPRGTIRVQ